MKEKILFFSLFLSVVTIQAQITSRYTSEIFAMMPAKESNRNKEGLIYSNKYFSVIPKHILLDVPTDMSNNRSLVKFRIKAGKHFIVNSFNILFGRQTCKNEHQAKCFSLISRSKLKRHLKELEILNGANCYSPITVEHLCLKLPQSRYIKICTMQDEQRLKGTVQEEAISIGRLPQGVYLLEAWSLGQYQKEQLMKN
jgi:hypothetical protein